MASEDPIFRPKVFPFVARFCCAKYRRPAGAVSWSNRIAKGARSVHSHPGSSRDRLRGTDSFVVVTSRRVYQRRWRPSARWGITTRRFRREHPTRRRLAGSVKLKPRRIARRASERARACCVSPFLRCRSFATGRRRKRFLRTRWFCQIGATRRQRGDNKWANPSAWW